ncbi:MAG: sigma factor-like helix-turn-helix DNA-binding protein [Patescibacteria group bacterium]
MEEKSFILSEREKLVIRLRFGFEDNEKMSFRKIGQKIGATPGQVRQIQFKALDKIKKKFNQPSKPREHYLY